MMHFQKWRKASFYVAVLATASVASVAAALYTGNMTVGGALLLAVGATGGSTMAAELMLVLVKRRRR